MKTFCNLQQTPTGIRRNFVHTLGSCIILLFGINVWKLWGNFRIRLLLPNQSHFTLTPPPSKYVNGLEQVLNDFGFNDQLKGLILKQVRSDPGNVIQPAQTLSDTIVIRAMRHGDHDKLTTPQLADYKFRTVSFPSQRNFRASFPRLIKPTAL
jgi:hypothetical protein